MKLKKNIAVSESGYIFNPSNGDSFSVNPIGSEILSCMQTGMNVMQIRDFLMQRYEVDLAMVEQDLDDFIQQLSFNQFLENE